MRLLSSGNQISGKNSGVSVGGAFLNQHKFSVHERGDDLDTVNFGSTVAFAGLPGMTTITPDEGIIGVAMVEYALGGDWDAANNAYANPPAIFPRDNMASLALYMSRIHNDFWAFAYARVLSCQNGSDVRGKVSFEASGKNQGSYIHPIGNFTTAS